MPERRLWATCVSAGALRGATILALSGCTPKAEHGPDATHDTSPAGDTAANLGPTRPLLERATGWRLPPRESDTETGDTNSPDTDTADSGLDTGSPDPGVWRSVTVGMTETACAISEGWRLACWGDNYYGQADAPEGFYSEVAPGNFHSCALDLDGYATCWGLLDHPDWDVGQADPPMEQLHGLSAGAWQSCALSTSNEVVCWGMEDVDGYQPPTGEFSQVSVGMWNSCALRVDGEVECWGWDGGESASEVDGVLFSTVSAGWTHACGIGLDGELYCWGGYREKATTIPEGVEFATISAGYEGNCGLDIDNLLTCWEDTDPDAGDFGCLREIWFSFPGDGPWAAVEVGGAEACVMDGDAQIQCWGCSWTAEIQDVPPNPDTTAGDTGP